MPAKVDAGGLTTWKDVVFKKDTDAMKHMLYYGDGDIISLEAVFKKILNYVKPNMQYAVLHGGNKYECPECGKLGRLRKTYTTAAGTIQHYFSCTDRKCLSSYKINNKTYMDFLQYKLRNSIK